MYHHTYIRSILRKLLSSYFPISHPPAESGPSTSGSRITVLSRISLVPPFTSPQRASAISARHQYKTIATSTHRCIKRHFNVSETGRPTRPFESRRLLARHGLPFFFFSPPIPRFLICRRALFYQPDDPPEMSISISISKVRSRINNGGKASHNASTLRVYAY